MMMWIGIMVKKKSPYPLEKFSEEFMGGNDIIFGIWFKIILTHTYTSSNKAEKRVYEQDTQRSSPFCIFDIYIVFFLKKERKKRILYNMGIIVPIS